MTLPKIGEMYRARGYVFRVDDIRDGEVYVVRWPESDTAGAIGEPIRVSVEVWEKEMADVAEDR